MGERKRKRVNKRPFADTDKVARDARRSKVAELYTQGYVMYPIAQVLGVSTQTISRDLEHVRKEWLANRVGDYSENLVKQLAGLDMQESQLWEAWHRSCKLEVITTVTAKRQLQRQTEGRGKHKKVVSEGMVTVEENEKTTTRQMIGDPRFQAEITRIRELRCKLLGLLEDIPPAAPVVNIWQQLQEMKYDRDTDEIEQTINSVRMLPERPIDSQGLGDSTGWREPSNGQLPNGFTDLDDGPSVRPPSDDTPLDIK